MEQSLARADDVKCRKRHSVPEIHSVRRHDVIETKSEVPLPSSAAQVSDWVELHGTNKGP